MRLNLATRDRVRIFTVLEHVSADIKIRGMVGKLKIVGLYEYNDVYQVIDSTDSVWFQGSKKDCKKYIKKNK